MVGKEGMELKVSGLANKPAPFFQGAFPLNTQGNLFQYPMQECKLVSGATSNKVLFLVGRLLRASGNAWAWTQGCRN